MAKQANITSHDLTTIPEVPYTATWSPVHHAKVFESVEMVLAGMGIEPIGNRVEVSKNQMDMFATIQLPAVGRDSLEIGFRNSMQQNFSLGLVGGHRVLVCSNMCFFGEFVEHRRHTSGLTPQTRSSTRSTPPAHCMAGHHSHPSRIRQLWRSDAVTRSQRCGCSITVARWHGKMHCPGSGQRLSSRIGAEMSSCSISWTPGKKISISPWPISTGYRERYSVGLWPMLGPTGNQSFKEWGKDNA